MNSEYQSLSQLASKHNDATRCACPAHYVMSWSCWGETKRWPITHYISLTKRLLDAGYAVHILGGPGEVDLGHQIQASTHNRCTNWTGKTRLITVADIIQHAHGVVANDSDLCIWPPLYPNRL